MNMFELNENIVAVKLFEPEKNSWILRAAILKLFQVEERLVHIQRCLKLDKSSSASP